MALVLKDRVKETTTTTGTGSISLLGQSIGYQSFSVVGNGNTCYYAISAPASNEWEVGIGTYSTTGPTLARTTVLSSSNSNTLVNLSAGTKDVYVVYPAEKAIYEEASGETLIDGGPITVIGSGVTSVPSLPAELGKFIGDVDSFAQIYTLNQNDGSTASADFVAYNDLTTDGYTYFTDMGISSSNYTSVDYPLFTPNSGYVFHQGGDFFIGNQTSLKDIKFFSGGVETADIVATFSGTDKSASFAGNVSVVGALDITGEASFGSTVLLNQDPTLALQAATKQYVDNQVTAGLHIHAPVLVETTGNLNATYTSGGTNANIIQIANGTDVTFFSVTPSIGDQFYIGSSSNGLIANTAYFIVADLGGNTYQISLTYGGASVTGLTNGSPTIPSVINSGVGAYLTNAGAQVALEIDNVALSVGNRVMVRLQTNGAENGVYTVTTVGDGSTNWVLTRATDCDKVNPSDPDGVGTGDYFYTQDGDANAGDSHVLTTEPNTMIIGYTPLTYTQFSGAVTYTGGTNIDVTGQVISLTGTVAATNGGTGTNTVTTGDLLYGSATNTWSKLPAGAAYRSLVMNSGGTQVEWNAVALNQSGAVSGSLGATNGGTGQNAYALGDTLYSSATNTLAKLSGNTTTTKKYLSQTGTGSASTAPSWDVISAADIGTGVLPAIYGGTGQSSYTVGDLVYADTTTTLAKLPDVGTGNVLLSGGANTAPAYGKVGLGTHVDGVLAVDNGGTGLSTLTPTAVLFASTTSAFSQDGDFNYNGFTLSAPELQAYENLRFFNTGAGNRITGDFSNATYASRVLFQDSTTNGQTSIGVIPNGSGVVSSLILYNSSSPDNSSIGYLQTTNSAVNLAASKLGTGTYLPLTMYTGGSERLRIDTSGNVGIGTNSPSVILDVRQNTAADTQFQIYNTNAGVYASSLKLNADNATGSRYNAIQSYNAGTAQWQISGGGSASTIAFGTGSSLTERMRIDSSGNVGIGQSGQVWDEKVGIRLDASGAGTAGLGIYSASSAYTGSMIRVQAETSGTGWKMYEGRASGGSQLFYIDGNGGGYFAGNVGIGTSAPNLTLTVKSPSSIYSGYYQYTNSASTTSYSILNNSSYNYIGTGTYFENGVWLYNQVGGASLFALTEQAGARWFSGNGASYSNVVSNISLWNQSGVWESSVNTAGTVTAASLVGPLDGNATYAGTSTGAVPTTSGTAVNISTTIPAGVKVIAVGFNEVSTNGTVKVVLRVGSGSFATSGYAAFGNNTSTTAISGALETAGFPMGGAAATAAELYSGVGYLVHVGGNTWSWSVGLKTTTAAGKLASGSITLGGPLDRVQITTLTAISLFDNGSISLTYW